MGPNSTTLVGRHARVTALGAGVAVLLVALGGAVGGPPTELWHAAVAVGAAVVPAAALAAYNDGLVVCWAVAAAPAFGATLAESGAVAVAVRTATVAGLSVGTAAFLLGVGGRWAVAGGRPPATTPPDRIA